jgi:DNA-binding transcriptional MocR family regulator
VQTALEEGVMFDPGSLFTPKPRDTVALRLCYSNAPIESFDEGVQRLGRALARWRRERL